MAFKIFGLFCFIVGECKKICKNVVMAYFHTNELKKKKGPGMHACYDLVALKESGCISMETISSGLGHMIPSNSSERLQS